MTQRQVIANSTYAHVTMCSSVRFRLMLGLFSIPKVAMRGQASQRSHMILAVEL